MNCFSACSIRACRLALLLALLPLAACDVSDSADRDNEREYNVHFTISPDPATSTVRVELRVRQRAAGDLEIVVSDNGIGIAAEDLQNITKPFFQANAELARQHDGVGLGLAIVSGCARAHGGEFIVESVPRVGTKARVIFPKSRVHRKDDAEESEEKEAG